MRKFSLRVDDLQVDSFDATPNDGRQRGTVFAKSDSTAPCWAATVEGSHCDSTQWQDLCTCTGGGADNTTCDVNVSCGGPETCGCAWTDPRYHQTCQEGC
jgi:hypothetical protein